MKAFLVAIFCSDS